MKYSRIISLLLLLIFVISAVGCGKVNKDTADDTTEITDSVDESRDDNSESSAAPSVYWEEDEEISDIVTPYITLEYPLSWNDRFSVENYEEGESYFLKFMGKDDFSDRCIFFLRFGGEDEGAYYLGQLDDVPVYVYVNDERDGLSEGQLEELSDLQGCVNDIMVQIQHAENFAKAE